MADELYIPQMDYTSRDYTSIRNDLIALIPNFAPQWTSRDSSDFGIVLLELFSYMGDLINYQIDRAANESFIDTATQRDTVLKLASILGYTPNSGTPATGTVVLKNNGSGSVTIPAGTVLTGTSTGGTDTSISFTLNSDTAITAGATASASITQGSLSTSESVGTSDGTKNQLFALANTGVFTNTTTGYISVLVGSVAYTYVQYIVDSNATDRVFTTVTEGDGTTYIKFGDASNGVIPPSGSAVTVTYRYTTTTPSLGNLGANGISAISTTANITISSSTTMTGGTDSESTDSIRVSAPKSIRALNRAVSLDDYASVAIQKSGVAKAIAIASAYSSISLYVAGANGTTFSTTELASIKSYFSDKIPPGTTVTVNNYTSAYPYLIVTVNVLPQYNAATVKSNVQAALASLFAFDNVTFNDVITEGDIFSACKAVDGVNYITITDFEKLGAATTTSGIYSFSAVTNGSTASGTNTVTVLSSAGLVKGALITAPSSIPANTTISTIATSGTSITLSSNTTATTATGTIISAQGNNGTTAGSRDFSCLTNEIPIYESSYVLVTTTGGS
jgi:hypothetical protein